MPSHQNAYILTRILAIAFMISLHSIVWMSSTNDFALDRSFINPQVITKLINQFAFIPLSLVLVAGMLSRRMFDFYKKEKLFYPIALKSAFFISAGFLLNVLAFSSHFWYQWDVLHFIGLSLLISFIIFFNVGKKGILFLGVISFFLPYVDTNLFILQDVFFGNKMGSSFYPFFPWYSLFSLGFFIEDFNLKKYIIPLFILLMAFVFLFYQESFFKVTPDNIWGDGLFIPSKLVLALNFSKILLLYFLCSFIPAQRLKRFSKHIFLIYIIHIVFGSNLSNYFYNLKTSWLVGQISLSYIIYFSIVFIHKKIIIKKIQKYLNTVDTNINEKTALIDESYLDSLGILNLLGFLSSKFNLKLELHEVTKKDLNSFESIEKLIETKELF